MSNTNGLMYGRRAPKNAPALRFASFKNAVVPDHPESYNATSGWGGWDMLGNDSIGDCVAVTWATIRRIVTRMHTTEAYPDLAHVIAIYQTQNPNFDPNGTSNTNGPGSQYDQGMDIQTLLEHLVKEGGPDGVKAIAFAKVDHTNVFEVEAAIATFGFVWYGVNVTEQNEQAFPKGLWDYDKEDKVLGGHSITGVGYNPDEFTFETWADEANMTDPYLVAGVEEAWVVIWPEHLVNMDDSALHALSEAYGAITGKSLVLPDVPVDPTPTPIPEPTTPLADFIAAASAWLKHHHTAPENKAMETAVRAFLAANGVTVA